MSTSDQTPQRRLLHPDLIPYAIYDDRGRRLCKATSKMSGERCRAPAMIGQAVCRKHGGATKESRARAKVRLMELVDPAISTLAREMATADTSADRQRAANSILDRAGWGRVSSVTADDARELLLAKLLAIRSEVVPNLHALSAAEDDDGDYEDE